MDLSGYQFQFANFSDERRAKASMTVPKGYITNKFQLRKAFRPSDGIAPRESFIISGGKKYILTLFVSMEHTGVAFGEPCDSSTTATRLGKREWVS